MEKKRERPPIKNDEETENDEEMTLFDADDDEEGTTQPKKKAESDSSRPSGESKQPSEEVYSPELLGMYYSRLFPYHFLHSWLSYDSSNLLPPSSSSPANATSKQRDNLFSHREFSFTIEPEPGNEIYLRYQSFSSQNDLASAVMKRRPSKIDIGAIFNHPPKNHNSLQKSTSSSKQFVPRQRELVFDVDLTDYDDVRNCGCQGANICHRCWQMMTMAVKVMDAGLKKDFGFGNVAWFYSGRRGVHAWVCDEVARNLTDEGRSAVAKYFEVSLGTDNNKNISLPNPLHPALSRAHEILEPMFINKILPASGHGLLDAPDQWDALLDTIPPDASAVTETLKKKWNNNNCTSTPAEKWSEVKRYLTLFIGKDSSSSSSVSRKSQKKLGAGDRIKIEQWPVQTVFKYTYPRLDINVSKMRNHLLKSPFCVHPKTGRVCVPIRTSDVDAFDPFSVPTLPLLMKELNEYENKNGDSSSEKIEHEWQKTSLREPFEHFRKDFLVPMWKDLRRTERREKEERAALIGDF